MNKSTPGVGRRLPLSAFQWVYLDCGLRAVV